MYSESQCKSVIPGPIYVMDNEYYMDKDYRLKLKVEIITDEPDDFISGE